MFHRSFFTSLVTVSPAGGPAVSTVMESAVIGCQTHRPDGVCELEGSGHLHQSDVVFFGGFVIGRVPYNLCHKPCLCGVNVLLVLKTQVHSIVVGNRRTNDKRCSKDTHIRARETASNRANFNLSPFRDHFTFLVNAGEISHSILSQYCMDSQYSERGGLLFT